MLDFPFEIPFFFFLFIQRGFHGYGNVTKYKFCTIILAKVIIHRDDLNEKSRGRKRRNACTESLRSRVKSSAK